METTMEETTMEYKKGDIPTVVDNMLKEVFFERSPVDPVGDMVHALERQRLAKLNAKHGVENRVTFATGIGGQTKVVLQHGDGATDGNIAEVYLNGAHVTRWSVGGYDALWMSPDAVFEPGKAIRGGIPICWPQFGPGELAQHGFLRNSTAWEVHDTEANENNVVLSLRHVSNPATRKLWDHDFTVVYSIHLKPHTLTTTLRVENTGTTPFDFTTALHTYFNVPHIDAARVEGLKNLSYLDNLQGRKECVENGDEQIHITKETDRIYIGTPEELVVHDGYHGKTVLHKSPSLPDAVLWNPWVNKARAMRDFNNYGWRTMVCVESGAIKNPVNLKPNDTWYGSQTLSTQLAPVDA